MVTGNKILKAGLIGCGSLGRMHTDCLSKLDGMKMVAFCDMVEASAKKLCEEYEGEYFTTDPELIFSDSDLDAVYVCTHHDTHADFCIKAANAKKHVFVEKPLALTVEDCKKIGLAVVTNGIKLFSAFKMRYYELILKAKELIPEPIMVVMQMMDGVWGPGIWANDPVKGGGNVLSQGCHSCDILRFVAGSEPINVFAAGKNYYQTTGVIDNMCAVFNFANGVSGCLIQGDSNTPPLTSKFFMEIFAKGRSITLSDRLCTLTYKEAGKDTVVIKGTETGLLEENKAFIDCIINDEKPAIDHIDGLAATLMVIQAFKSLKSGKPEPVALHLIKD